MASSETINGSFSGGTGSSHYGIRIVWETIRQYRQNGPHSVLRYQVQVIHDSGWNSYNANTGFTLTVDGSTQSWTDSFNFGDIPGEQWTTIINDTVTLAHDADGTRSCGLAFELRMGSSTTAGTGSVSGTAVLDPLTVFYWTGSSASDLARIAAGEPITNLTAAKWNEFNGLIQDYIDSSYTYDEKATGDVITRTIVENAANKLGVTLSQDNVVRAAYFIALRDALNNA